MVYIYNVSLLYRLTLGKVKIISVNTLVISTAWYKQCGMYAWTQKHVNEKFLYLLNLSYDYRCDLLFISNVILMISLFKEKAFSVLCQPTGFTLLILFFNCLFVLFILFSFFLLFFILFLFNFLSFLHFPFFHISHSLDLSLHYFFNTCFLSFLFSLVFFIFIFFRCI